MRAYYRPGATPHERLESQIAHLLCSRPEMPSRLVDLLVWAAGLGPAREAALREVLAPGCVTHPGEALGMARATLFFCGVTPEYEEGLSGRAREDMERLMRGHFHPRDLASPDSYAVPSLVEGYCYMGISFARGMDKVFGAITGQPLGEHLQRALDLLQFPT